MVTIRRKVVLQGGTALTVSLPSGWVKEHGIKKGDDVEITEELNELMISVEKKEEKKSITIDLTGLVASLIYRNITSAYREGYEELCFVFDNPQTEDTGEFNYCRVNIIEIIQRAVNRLVGVEIVEQTVNKCTIKELSTVKYTEFEVILRKIFLLLISSMQTLIEQKNKSLIKASIRVNEDTVNKFCDFCARLLKQKGYKDYKSTLTLYSLITKLEVIGDQLTVLSRIPKESPVLFDMLKKILYQFTLVYNLFYKFDIKKLNESFCVRNEVHRVIDCTNKTKLNYLLDEIIDNTADLCDDILSLQMSKHSIHPT